MKCLEERINSYVFLQDRLYGVLNLAGSVMLFSVQRKNTAFCRKKPNHTNENKTVNFYRMGCMGTQTKWSQWFLRDWLCYASVNLEVISECGNGGTNQDGVLERTSLKCLKKSCLPAAPLNPLRFMLQLSLAVSVTKHVHTCQINGLTRYMWALALLPHITGKRGSLNQPACHFFFKHRVFASNEKEARQQLPW